jgi:hypothetical protein
MIDWIICARPGRVRETRPRVVRNERSFIRPHRYYMNVDMKTLITRPPVVMTCVVPLVID